MVSRLITDPGTFFEQRTARPGFVKPLLILGIVGVAFALEGLAVVMALGEAAGPFSVGLSIYVATKLVQPYLLWFGFTIVLYVSTKWAGGHPTLSRLLRFSAWGLLPLVLTGIVWSAGRYLSLLDASRPTGVNTSFIREVWTALQSYLAQSAADPAYVGGTLLGVLLIAATVYLLVPAVRVEADLDRRSATIAVAIPVALLMAWLLWSRLA